MIGRDDFAAAFIVSARKLLEDAEDRMTFEQTLAAELLGVASRAATLALDELTRSDEHGTKEPMPKKKASKKS